MSSPDVFDPEVLALLEEIVADPNSSLMRVPDARLSKWIAKREAPVSAGEPLFSRAERHLVQKYRDSVAMVLYRACQRKLLEQPLWRAMAHRRVLPDRSVEIPVEATWHGEVSRELTALNPVADCRPGLELLEKALGNGVGGPTPDQYAAASLRLAPADETRIWLAMSLTAEGHSRSSLMVLDAVLGWGPAKVNESFAREDKGFVFLTRKDLRSAMEEYVLASLADESRANPVMAWLNMAFQLGDRQGVLEANSRLAWLVDAENPSVVEHLAMWRARREQGKLSPTRDCTQLARELEDRLAPAARRIAHVFL